MNRRTEEKVRELLRLKRLLAEKDEEVKIAVKAVIGYLDHELIVAKIERLEAEIKEEVEDEGN